MAKLLLICTIVLLFYTLTASATIHNVGDSGGWDISTDLDSWSRDKTFTVGDTLWFQYSQYHSVSELTKENYEGCNTTNVLQSSSNGNTTIALTAPGDRYFVCGNRLHCLGGMKLHVHVLANQTAPPVGAPEVPPGGGGALPPGSAKSNNPSNSAFLNRIRIENLVLGFFGSFAILFNIM